VSSFKGGSLHPRLFSVPENKDDSTDVKSSTISADPMMMMVMAQLTAMRGRLREFTLLVKLANASAMQLDQ
jgi:hypothetical protein